MKPAARIAAAIDVLDLWLAGSAAEQALTRWARGARYAGSKDRAAVRDLVFEAVRRMRSDAAIGGAQTGRGLMLGRLRRLGLAPDEIFTGLAYAPKSLTQAEQAAGGAPAEGCEQLDIPDWLWPEFSHQQQAAQALQSRSAICLRVNARKSDLDQAISALGKDGITALPHATVRTALIVQDGARRIRQSAPYLEGFVELQDASSQAVITGLPLLSGMRVLDYCAGGGGKSLAMAARADIDLFAYDIAPQRMSDLPERAARAGVRITQLDAAEIEKSAPFDLVLCDAPCSGSGAWRRSPQGKWSLTPHGLAELRQKQQDVLRAAATLTSKNGVLAYVTCSCLRIENEDQTANFLATFPKWKCDSQEIWPIEDESDGFYAAHFTRAT